MERRTDHEYFAEQHRRFGMEHHAEISALLGATKELIARRASDYSVRLDPDMMMEVADPVQCLPEDRLSEISDEVIDKQIYLWQQINVGRLDGARIAFLELMPNGALQSAYSGEQSDIPSVTYDEWREIKGLRWGVHHVRSEKDMIINYTLAEIDDGADGIKAEGIVLSKYQGDTIVNFNARIVGSEARAWLETRTPQELEDEFTTSEYLQNELTNLARDIRPDGKEFFDAIYRLASGDKSAQATLGRLADTYPTISAYLEDLAIIRCDRETNARRFQLFDQTNGLDFSLPNLADLTAAMRWLTPLER